MGIEIPGTLKPVAWLASGSDWPEGDETSLRRLAEEWAAAAAGLGDLASRGDSAIRDARSAVEGDIDAAIDQHWRRLDGDTGALEQLIKLCDSLSDSCESTATDVEYAKLSIIAALTILLAELVAMAAAAVPTLGASTAGAVAAEAATQVTIRIIIRDLILSIIEHAAIEAAKSVALDGALQTLQIITGGRDAFDTAMLRDSLISGAVEGAEKALSGEEGWGDRMAANTDLDASPRS